MAVQVLWSIGRRLKRTAHATRTDRLAVEPQQLIDKGDAE